VGKKKSVKKGKVKKIGFKKKGKKNVSSIKSELDGIKFASNLERFCYIKLKEAGLHNNLKYEGTAFNIIDKFEFKDKKYQGIKITPDFVDEENKVIIECKGFMGQNQLFPMRWKLMKRYFKLNNLDYDIHLVFNQGEILEAINKIKLKYNVK
jgi:hypothetical protein